MGTEEIKKNIILLGDPAVGKTSLIRRYVLDQFDERYVTTIGSKVTKKEVLIQNGGDPIRIIMLIWDIIGQKEYELTQTLSMKNIDGAILVSDMTRAETIESLSTYWLPKIKATRGNIPLVFLANKSDMADERVFGVDELEETAKSGGVDRNTNLHCFATSAKTGENIESAFHMLAGSLLEKMNTVAGDIPIQDIIRNSEAKSLAGVVDFIIADFADQYGGMEVATPIVKHQMAMAGLELANPTLTSVTKFIDCMANVEKTFKPSPDVSDNRQTRLQKLKDL